MKIIVAGQSKTGTKSMVVALQEIGFSVYDYMDHFWYHGTEWEKICRKGGSKDDFKRMYEDVDAITDAPPFHFWEEIHGVFPDAKIILTTRDEDEWYKSFGVQFQQLRKNYLHCILQYLSPTGWKYFRFFQTCVMIGTGMQMKHPLDYGFYDNEMIFRKIFRRHKRDCIQNAPKDKLLVYSVKEGWEPLCKFLGKDVPDKPFPHENIAGAVMDKLMREHPACIRMQREMFITLSVLFVFFAVGVTWLLGNLS